MLLGYGGFLGEGLGESERGVGQRGVLGQRVAQRVLVLLVAVELAEEE